MALPPKYASEYSPEQRLLIELTAAGTDSHGRIEALLRESLDWNYIVRTAVEHGVAPFLYANAKQLCPDKEALQKLNTFYLNNLKRNMALTNELVNILSLFESQGIRAIPFKGPFLAQQLYNDIGLRQSSDIDLLILKDDYYKVKDILLMQEYEPEFKLSRRQEIEFLKYQCEMPFLHLGKGLITEIHWDLAPRIFHFALCQKGLRERLQTYTFAGKTVQSLSAEDLLIYLCFHGSKHGWERLAWIYDILMIIKTSSLDWSYILKKSEELGSTRPLLLGLCIADYLWGVSIPPEARKGIKADTGLSYLAPAILRDLFHREKSLLSAPRSITYRAILQKNLRLKLNIIFSRLFRPIRSDWQAVSIPDRTYFLYYFIRPLRLLGKLGQRMK